MYEDENLLVFREILNKTTMIWKLKIAAIIFVPPNSHVMVLKMEPLREE